MPVELPPVWTTLLNVAGCAAIQLGLAWLFTRLPDRWFDAPTRPVKRRSSFYERWLAIRSWKDRLPDGAKWLGGFAKASLNQSDAAHLHAFIRETRRGELCHWAAIGCMPMLFLWNPWWADLILMGYALAANLPCILVQRYNRNRLTRTVSRHDRGTRAR